MVLLSNHNCRSRRFGLTAAKSALHVSQGTRSWQALVLSPHACFLTILQPEGSARVPSDRPSTQPQQLLECSHFVTACSEHMNAMMGSCTPSMHGATQGRSLTLPCVHALHAHRRTDNRRRTAARVAGPSLAALNIQPHIAVLITLKPSTTTWQARLHTIDPKHCMPERPGAGATSPRRFVHPVGDIAGVRVNGKQACQPWPVAARVTRPSSRVPSNNTCPNRAS